MAIDLDALALPAFVDLENLPGERDPWLSAYDLDGTLSVPGVPEPLHHGDGLGVVPTGIGKCAAATTVTALCSTPEVDISDALVVSVGVAGGPPSEVTVGSVVVAETLVDWDDKVRWADAEGSGVMPNPYTGDAGVYDLDSERLERVRDLVADVELADDESLTDHRAVYDPEAARGDPAVVFGTNVCGDELWHGESIASEVESLLDDHGVGTYCATEMEDAGTARALDRFGKIGDYCSVRGVSNFDRRPPGEAVGEAFIQEDLEAGVPVALENAVRVARTVVDDQL